MRARYLTVAGASALALVAAAAFAPANASSSGAGAAKASASLGFHGKAHATALPKHINAGAKCGSGFGTELATPDGLIAGNDTSGAGFDTAGGAAIQCKGKAKKRTIKTVQAYGYFGAATEQFNVTFYGNSTTSGSNEPADGKVLCSYTGLTGSAGGSYPTHALTSLTLTSKCKLPKGISWVSIQNNDAAGPWYWEMQNEANAGQGADWIDRHDVFGSGCTTFDNDRFLVDCLGYPYPGWMLLVK